MPRRLFDIYQRRRIININVNILSAGFLALGLALIPVHYTRKLGITDELAITIVGTTCDIVFDVFIYYVLHWVANHWNPKWSQRHAAQKADPEYTDSDRKFFREATLIQFERACFAPMYYAISSGVNYTLLRTGVEREWAFAWGFIVGISITRIAHTLWGIKTGRFKDNAPRKVTVPERADSHTSIDSTAPTDGAEQP